MNRIILCLVVAAFAGSAEAASITNRDGQAYSLSVTEGGVKSDIVNGPGETVTACVSGCFLTLPSGDREALGGSENIDIVGGKAVFR